MLLTTATAWAQTTESLGGYTFTIESDAEGSYYKVDCENALRAIATYVNAGNDASGKRFKQTADITLTEAIAQIGNLSNILFKGTYDGGDHSISGLVISTNTTYVGLFGRVYGGTVENLRLISPSITNTIKRSENSTGPLYVGGIAGQIDNSGKIDNCHVISPSFSFPNVANPGDGGLHYGAILGACGYRLDKVTDCYYYSDTYGCMGIDENGNKILQNCARVYTLTLGSDMTATADLTIGTATYCKEGSTVTLGHADRDGYIFGGYTVNGATIDGNTFSITADATVAATFTPDPAHFELTATDEYTIHTAEGWGVFCDALQDNDTWNRFSGKTVKLGASIGTAQNPITRWAGSSGHEFCGSFDGDGHTLTVDYSSNYYADTAAPFSYVSGATIQNLVVAGNCGGIYGRAAGIVGESTSMTTITNCISSVTISGDPFNGGISIGGLVDIEGCIYNGRINTTDRGGGFVGFAMSTTRIANSLFDPQEGSTIVGGTFYNTSNTATITNSYYTAALGTVQGKAPLAVTAGENVTVESVSPVGNPVENGTYTVSGITAYAKGITRTVGQTTTFYYGQGDEVSLTLGNTAPTDLHTFSQYTVSPDGTTLTGTQNPYTLTMPNADVTIGATFTPQAKLDLKANQAPDDVLGMTTVNEERHFGFHTYTGTEMAACKAFLHVTGNGARSLKMVFGDATGIKEAEANSTLYTLHSTLKDWYTLDGRRLNGKPTQPGIYVNNGHKVVIK